MVFECISNIIAFIEICYGTQVFFNTDVLLFNIE